MEVRETWVEIFHLPEMELVTAIEILTPSNKGGYRPFGLSGQARWVDPSTGQSGRDRSAPERRADADLWGPCARAITSPWSPRRSAPSGRRLRLAVAASPSGPAHPPPLADPDISLDLGEASRLTYDRGGYSRVMRYGRPLPESLRISTEDRNSAEDFGR